MSEGTNLVGDLWVKAEDTAMDAAILEFRRSGRDGEMTPLSLGVIHGSWEAHGDRKGIRLVELKLSGERPSIAGPLLFASIILAVSLDVSAVIGCKRFEGASSGPLLCESVETVNGPVYRVVEELAEWLHGCLSNEATLKIKDIDEGVQATSCTSGEGYCS